jgi:hypothetical protein
MDTSSKCVWLFTNEHEQALKKLGSFIEEFFCCENTTDPNRFIQERKKKLLITIFAPSLLLCLTIEKAV